MSGRNWLYVGCPTTAPSMYTSMVEPSNGIAFGFGVSAHPKLMTTPGTVSPCLGGWIVPKGNALPVFAATIGLEPITDDSPLIDRATAYRVNVPLPPFGRKLLSTISPQPARDTPG